MLEDPFYGHIVDDDRPTMLPFWTWAVIWGLVIAGALYGLKADAQNTRTLVYSDPRPCKSELVLPLLNAA